MAQACDVLTPRESGATHPLIQVYHTKVLSGTKKERNQWGFFVVSKVLLDKGITNRTIGQSLRVDFPKSKPSLYNQKKEGETLTYSSIGGIKRVRPFRSLTSSFPK